MSRATDLAALTARPGLAPVERALTLAMAALTAYELDDFEVLAELARDHGATQVELRELCLMGVPYAGFPRALAALFRLEGRLDDGAGRTLVQDPERGMAYFRTIYGRHADKLVDRIVALDPAFADCVLGFAYGAVLGRPDLGGRTRELCGVASLVVLAQQEQCQAHAAGALRFGASEDEVLETVVGVESCWPSTRGQIDHDGLRAFLSKLRARGL